MELQDNGIQNNGMEAIVTRERRLWGIAGLGLGVGLGAVLMYFWDPNRGKLRRATLQDKASSAARKTRHEARKRAEDVLNRAKGVMATADAGLPIEANVVGDETVAARVRGHLGHVTHHAHDIQTEVTAGVVTLRGTVEAEKHRHMVDEILAVPGVNGVRDLLIHVEQGVAK